MALSKYTSLSTRLSITTSLIVSVVITAIAIYVFGLKSDQIEVDNRHEVELNLANTALNINKRLSLVESAMGANVWAIDKYVTKNTPDSVMTVLKELLTLNNDIIGCGVAFNVDYDNPIETPYMIYAARDSIPQKHYLSINRINSEKGDYNWMYSSLATGMPLWTYPHNEPHDHFMKVCSFTMPVKNRTNDNRVIFFADIPTTLIGEVISYNEPESVVEAFMIDQSGKCLYVTDYPKKSKTKYLKLSQSINEELLNSLGDSIQEGNNGVVEIHNNGNKFLTFYDIVNTSGWTLFYVSDFTQKSSLLIKSTRILLCTFFIMIAVLFLGLSFVIKRTIKPLTKFSDSALEISKGNFDTTLPRVNTNDEMSLLYDSFATMQRSIKRYTEELEDSTRKQAFILGELQIASRIQDDLLPKTFPPFPERADIDIRAKLIPAKQIGGDLYNYFMRDNKVYFIIADVSGKSVPAALVMAIANNVFVTVSPQCTDPADIMHELNITTCANNEHSGFFITALVGILDLSNGELKLCNAGHDPSLLIDGNDEVTVLRLTPNLPVGIINGYKYVSVAMTLTEHTRLLMYTDGITEAENGNKQFFGLNNLIDCVKMTPGINNSSLIDRIVSDVNLFAPDNENTDDITILLVEYKPSDVKMPEGLTLFNDIRELDKVKDFANAITTAMGTDENTAVKVNLALEEAISNIINYSFTHSGNNVINIYASAHKGMVTIIISDTGQPFDPTKTDNADTNAPLEKRPIGGLGITLIRSICSDMRYLRQNNHNYLTLVFDFSRKTNEPS